MRSTQRIFRYPPESREHQSAFWLIIGVTGVVYLLAGLVFWAMTGEEKAILVGPVVTVLMWVCLRVFLRGWWGR